MNLQKTRTDEATAVFQLIIKTFPTSSFFLKIFCKIQEKARNFTALENVWFLSRYDFRFSSNPSRNVPPSIFTHIIVHTMNRKNFTRKWVSNSISPSKKYVLSSSF